MTTTRPAAKKATATRRAVKRPADRLPKGIKAVDEVEPLNLDALPQEAPEAPEVHLFTLNDVDYYVPSTIPAGLTLRFLKMARHEGEIQAGGWLLEAVLGEAAYDALMSWEGLTNDILTQLVGAVNKLAAGSASGATRPLGR